MADKSMTKQNQSTALDPATMDQLVGFEGAGFEGADQDTYAIPFLRILQSGSPQCKKSAGEYVPGAEEGMLFNTVTAEVFDGDAGVRVIPCAFQRVFTHWRNYDDGGGFLGEYPVDHPIVNQGERGQSGKLVLDDGTELQDTRKHYCLMLREDGSWDPLLITMSSTQIKKSRQLMTRLRNLKLRNSQGRLFTPPMFANVVTLKTASESNDQNSWFGWHVDFQQLRQLDLNDPAEGELFQAAKDFAEACQAGQVKEAEPRDEAPAEGDDDPDF